MLWSIENISAALVGCAATVRIESGANTGEQMPEIRHTAIADASSQSVVVDRDVGGYYTSHPKFFVIEDNLYYLRLERQCQ
jgi:hypothetical protein